MVQLKLGFFADYGQQSVSVKKYWAILLSQLREWITQGTGQFLETFAFMCCEIITSTIVKSGSEHWESNVGKKPR